jgi:hypothetical protein
MKMLYCVPAARDELIAACEAEIVTEGIGIIPPCSVPDWCLEPGWDPATLTWYGASGTGAYRILDALGTGTRILYDGAWRAFGRHVLIPDGFFTGMRVARVVDGSKVWPDLVMAHEYPPILAAAYGAYPDDYPGEDGPQDKVREAMRRSYGQRAREWDLCVRGAELAMLATTGRIIPCWEPAGSWAPPLDPGATMAPPLSLGDAADAALADEYQAQRAALDADYAEKCAAESDAAKLAALNADYVELRRSLDAGYREKRVAALAEAA